MSLIFPVLPLFGRGGAKKPPEFVSSSINRVNSSTNTVTAPASIAPGDFLIMVGCNTSSRLIDSPPSGWTEHLNDDSDTPTAHVFSKVATGSEPTDYTWGWSGSSRPNTISLLCYRNASAVDLVGARARNSTATSTAPAITPTQSGALIAVFGIDEKWTVSTPPAGMTQRAAFTDETNVALAVYDLIPSPAGASSGDKALTWSGSKENIGWQLQIY